MKKSLFILIVCLLVSRFAFAQENNGQLSYGLRAGVNYGSKIYELKKETNNNLFKFNYNAGAYLGGFVTINLSDKISLQPELLLSYQRVNYEFNFTQLTLFDPSDPRFSRVNGFEIEEFNLVTPVLLKFDATNKFSVFLGPQLSYSVYYEEKTVFQNIEGEQVIENSPNGSGFGVDAMLRVSYSFSEKVSADIGYTYGLTFRDQLKPSLFNLGIAYTL